MSRIDPGPPVILVVGGEHGEAIERELSTRYAHDYEIVATRGLGEAIDQAQWLDASHRRVALVVAEDVLPDSTGLLALKVLQSALPTAKRVALLCGDDVSGRFDAMREAQQRGGIDFYAVLPRGPRDEEFHASIVDMLSEWGWTVAGPEVPFVTIVCEADCPRTARLKDYLDRMGLPSRTLRDSWPEGQEIVARAREEHGDAYALPVVVTMHRPTACNPTLAEVGRAMFGGLEDLGEDPVVDLAIIGAGPAGLAAAVYGASEGLATIVLDADAIGGQAGSSSMIRNYLGFPRGISGMRLAQRARVQASRFGARFFSGQGVRELVPAYATDDGCHRVRTDGGEEVRARAVVIATGVSYRRLGVESLEALVGRGVNYGAAASTAREMAGQDVYVVGGGNSAGQAAVHLSRFARSVTIVVRRASLAETMSAYLIAEITGNRKIRVLPHTEVVDGGGDPRLGWITLRDNRTGEDRNVPAAGLYLLLGAQPRCDWLPPKVALDDKGFVLTGADTPEACWRDGRPPASLATNVPGVYAAGDVRAGSMKRVASASGEGAAVVPLVHAHLDGLAREATPEVPSSRA